MRVKYNQVIPVEKFQKMSYPKRYIEGTLLPTTLKNNTLNFSKLVERDLYGVKGKRINSIHTQINKLFSLKKSESLTPIFTKSNPITFIEDLSNQSLDINKKALMIFPCKKNFSTQTNKCTETVELNEECQWSIPNEDLIDCEDQFEEDISPIRRQRIKGMKKLLKYMLEIHSPVTNKVEANKYVKGLRNSNDDFLFETSTLHEDKAIQLNKKTKSVNNLKVKKSKTPILKKINRCEVVETNCNVICMKELKDILLKKGVYRKNKPLSRTIKNIGLGSRSKPKINPRKFFLEEYIKGISKTHSTKVNNKPVFLNQLFIDANTSLAVEKSKLNLKSQVQRLKNLMKSIGDMNEQAKGHTKQFHALIKNLNK